MASVTTCASPSSLPLLHARDATCASTPAPSTQLQDHSTGSCYNVHGELISRYTAQRQLKWSHRAVDNQIYFAMCSPARDLTAGYHAVSKFSFVVGTKVLMKYDSVGALNGRRSDVSSLYNCQSRCSYVFSSGPKSLPKHKKGRGLFLRTLVRRVHDAHELPLICRLDPAVFHTARANIPVTTQRRFDVYPDVSKRT